MASTAFTTDTLPDLSAKVFLVTGGSAGIGRATVAGLASRGARVYMGARSEAKAQQAIEAIKKELPSADIKFLELDLASLESTARAAREFQQQETVLHGLINNAGIMAVPFALTRDGIESQFQTNYLSHWLLTHHLLPVLQETATRSGPGEVRIVNVSSDGHERFAPKEGIQLQDVNLESASSFTRYGQSKLANVLHIKELNRNYGPNRLEERSGAIVTAAVHPGHISTNLGKGATGAAPAPVLRAISAVLKCAGMLDDEEKGALSSLYAIASPEFTDSGAYVVPYAKIGVPSGLARDAELARKLWDWTCAELGKRNLV